MEYTNKKFSEKIQFCYKFWINTDKGEYALSDRRMKLLIDIHELGSLTAATKKRNISYRKAWGDLREAEELLGFHLLDRHRGGHEGGSTYLTEKGKILVTGYKEFIQIFDEKIKEASLQLIETIKGLDDLIEEVDYKNDKLITK